jgi:carbon-monoxide dehydrogenase small subunit
MKLMITINGNDHSCELPPATRLLDLLRSLGYTGTKEGCGEGECGACSVLLDGELVNSCIVPVAQTDGSVVLTIEGLSSDAELAALAGGFASKAGAQCGFCTPGMMLAAASLLKKNQDPSEEEIREALSGNLCRCTGYVKIVDSVRDASARLSRQEDPS